MRTWWSYGRQGWSWWCGWHWRAGPLQVRCSPCAYPHTWHQSAATESHTQDPGHLQWTGREGGWFEIINTHTHKSGHMVVSWYWLHITTMTITTTILYQFYLQILNCKAEYVQQVKGSWSRCGIGKFKKTLPTRLCTFPTNLIPWMMILYHIPWPTPHFTITSFTKFHTYHIRWHGISHHMTLSTIFQDTLDPYVHYHSPSGTSLLSFSIL